MTFTKYACYLKKITFLEVKNKMRFEDKWIHLSIIHQVSG